MSHVSQSAGGRAKFGREAQSGPASPADDRAGPSACPLPFPGSLAAAEPLTGETALRQQLALCAESLRRIACGCLDAIELTRTDFDDGDGLLTRLLERQLRVMGAEAEHVLRAVRADAVLRPWEWVLSEKQAEMVRALEGRA